MADVLRIKRRPVGGAAGPPSALAAAEVAFNEQDNTLYYGKGDSAGNATSIIPIAAQLASVTPGTYTNATVTVDAYGRITAISSGAAGASITISDTPPP